MLLFGCVALLSIGTWAKTAPGVFVQPDYESSWKTIQAANDPSLTTLRLAHGLGETPLLVDVQVKVTSGANQNYIFPASGCRHRDDDQPEAYGGVIYIYNEKEVYVSAPTKANDYLGRCVYAGLSPYWEGPTTEDTYIAEVKVRCWKAGTLPTPDFSETGIYLEAGTSTYVTRNHTIGDYPALVVSRTQLGTGSSKGYYSDSIGSPVIKGRSSQSNGYVVMGYSATAIRVWAPTAPKDYVFDASDGWAINGTSVNGSLELYAWSESSLAPNVTGLRTLGPSVASADLQESYTSVGTTDETFVRAWVHAIDGKNNGFLFPGTGMSAYETTSFDTTCMYGGLQYAYTDTNFRFWQPGNGAKGFLVCIPETIGGVNDQASTKGLAQFSAWHLDLDDCLSEPCQNGSPCSNFAWGYTCECTAGFTGTVCEINIDECYVDPCNNGGTCIDDVNGYMCMCASGWTGTVCDTDVTRMHGSDFLLFGNGTGFTAINIDDPSIRINATIFETTIITAIDFDDVGKRVYFAYDSLPSSIASTDLLGDDFRDESSDTALIETIALDSRERLLFYISYLGDLVVYNLDDFQISTLQSHAYNYISRSMVLDKSNRWIYWLDYYDTVRKVTYDGQNLAKIPLQGTYNIAIDLHGEFIYVCDDDGILYRSDLNGTNIKLLGQITANGRYGLVIFRDSLIFQYSNALYTYNITTDATKVFTTDVSVVTDIKLIKTKVITACEKLVPPTNGHISSKTGDHLGDTASIQCDQGYKLDGSNYVACQRNATWSKSPICNKQARIGEHCTSESECIAEGAICVNSTCSCLSGIYNEESVQCDTIPLLAYGSAVNDTRHTKQTICSDAITFRPGIPVFSRMYRTLFVCSQGLVSFGLPYSSPTPPSSRQDLRKIANRTVVAPFYANINISAVSVFYRTYDIFESKSNMENNSNISEIRSIVEQQTGFTFFSPAFVLVATWERAMPFGCRNPCEQSSTFQQILISDGTSTFSMFIYGHGQMSWEDHGLSLFPAWAGYVSADGKQSTHPYSFTPKILKLDERLGEIAGLVFHPLTQMKAGEQNHAVECIKWYNDELQNKEDVVVTANGLPECPCDIWLSFFDPWFWNIEWKDGEACVDMFAGIDFNPHGKSCCYNVSTWTWLRDMPGAGQFYQNHPTYKREHYLSDILPRKHCCDRSEFCDLFYELRPTGKCYRKSPYDFGTFWGDPHFLTLDGLNFTFNGLGEYTLLQIRTENITFDLQARTSRAVRKDGTSFATVFSAFAAKDHTNASLHVELNNNNNGSFVFANRKDVTRMFNADTKVLYTVNTSNIVLSKLPKSDTIRAFFPSTGIHFNISLHAGMLTINVIVPEKFKGNTTGLLGNYDEDLTNDFRMPNGTTVNVTLPEKDIFSYGQSWEINPNNSAFLYPPCKKHSDYHNDSYTPKFLDEIEEGIKDSAADTCGGIDHEECVFDVIVTERAEVGNATDQIKRIAETTQADIEEIVPYLEGCSITNTSLRLESYCNISSDYPDHLHFYENSVNATFDSKSMILKFVPQDTNPIRVKLSTRSPNGRWSSSFTLKTFFCTGCSGRGICVYEDWDDPRQTDSTKYARCECEPQYEGDDCERVYDGCASNPCSHGRNCTPLSDSEQIRLNSSHLCAPCDVGFNNDSVDLNNCHDIDECADDPCEHSCTNIPGSYICTCDIGYRVGSTDKTKCRDINECDDAIHNCKHICNNTLGGYICECHPGYILVGNDCQQDNDTKLCDDNDIQMCNNTSGCTKSNGTTECFCEDGYELDQTEQMCTDINECDRNICSQKCDNTDGGFTCSCLTGFEIVDRVNCKECSVGTWGDNCAHSCNCSAEHTLSCDHVKGCMCEIGWKGNTCNVDVDECRLTNDVCKDSRKICNNTIGSFNCDCMDGYILKPDNNHCEDINECLDPTLNNCDQNCTNTVGGYSCTCHQGYTKGDGNKCVDINECSVGTDECAHVCENYDGGYNCFCHHPYRLNDNAKTCFMPKEEKEKNNDPCSYIPANMTCSHLCTKEADQTYAQCVCPRGYQLGPDKQTCTDINECEDPLATVCSEVGECTNTVGGYTCSCPVGTHLGNDGRTCSECDEFHFGENCSHTCTCIHGQSDKLSGCMCDNGWSGLSCDLDKDECAHGLGQMKCEGGNRVCINLPGSAHCACKQGYFEQPDGEEHCSDIDECLEPSTNTCDQKCTNTQGSYECSCENGFIFVDGKCRDINECIGDDRCDHICENIVGSYRCNCEDGYRLNLTDHRSCILQNECDVEDITNCTNRNASCAWTATNQPLCRCEKGFYMKDGTCHDIDECSDNKGACSQTCTNQQGGFECSCRNGFFLLDDGLTCRECLHWTFGEQCLGNCSCKTENSISCSHETGGCACKSGWSGPACEYNIDECANTTNICNVNSDCHDTDGSYYCLCHDGFYQTSTGTCKVCDRGDFGDGCLNKCQCKMENTHTCNNVNGLCGCKQGWGGNKCDEDINECTTFNGVCSDKPNSVCLNTNGSYRCSCSEGFTEKDSKCSDEDECQENAHGCIQQCKNKHGSYECTCYPGYHGTWNECEECIGNTFGVNCSEACLCNVSNANNQHQSCDTVTGSCNCKATWTGEACNTDVNECKNDAICDSKPHSGCHNTIGGFSCDCLRGYRMNDKDCVLDSNRSVPTLPDTDVQINMSITLHVSLSPWSNLNVASTYTDIERKVAECLMEFYGHYVSGNIDIKIRDISSNRSGTLKVDYVILSNDTRTIIFVDLTAAVLAIASGEHPVYDGNHINVSSDQYHDMTACDIFLALGGWCNSKEDCKVEDWRPVCSKRQSDMPFDFGVILGSSFGALGIILLALILIVCVFRRTKQNRRHASERHNFDNSVIYPDRIDNHNRNRGIPTSPPASSTRDEISSDQIRVDKGEKNLSRRVTWKTMLALAPSANDGRKVKIPRPKAYTQSGDGNRTSSDI